MAIKIPTYDQPVIQQEALPGVRVNTNAPNLLEPIAQGLGQVANVMQREQDAASALAAEEGLAKLRTDQLQIQQSVDALKGANALDPELFGGDKGSTLEKTASEVWFKKYVDERAQGLSGKAKEMYLRGAANMGAQILSGTMRHTAEQTLVKAKSDVNARFIAEKKNIRERMLDAEGSRVPGVLENSIASMEGAAAALAEVTGADVATAKLGASSEAISEAVDVFIGRKDYTRALETFKANKDKMLPEDAAATIKWLESIKTAITSTATVDTLMQDKTLTREMREDKLRSTFANDPITLAEARRELGYRSGLREAELDKVSSDELSTWHARWMEGKIRASDFKIQMSEGRNPKLNVEDRDRGISMYKSYVDAEARQNTPNGKQENYQAYLEYIQREDVKDGSISDRAMIEIQSKLGKENGELFSKHVAQERKLQGEFKPPTAASEAAGLAVGFPRKVSTWNSEQKGRMVEANSRAAAELSANRKQGEGAPLPNVWQATVEKYLRMGAPKAFAGEGWFGLDKKVPVANIRDEAALKLAVDDLGDAERSAMRGALIAAKLDPAKATFTERKYALAHILPLYKKDRKAFDGLMAIGAGK